MADYWIKLYIEMLEDPKIGTLPDGLCWRFVQVCLLAGKFNDGGNIPNTPQLAWVLRRNTDDLDHELQQLASVGLIERTVGGWFVKNFAKRQSRMTNAEKQKAYRDRQHHDQYQDSVTGALPKVTQITDNRLTESETEAEGYFTANPLSVAFEEASNILAPGNDAKKWIAACEHMQKLGITPDEVKQAVHELNKRNYTIIGPSSIVNGAINVHTKKNGKANVPAAHYGEEYK